MNLLAQDYGMFQFLQELLAGDTQAWIVAGVVAVFVFGIAIRQRKACPDRFSSKGHREN